MTAARELLIVDDDDDLRGMLRELFQDEGYRVWDAPSAEAALELTREHELDAVLSDVNMSGKSGIELVGELRRVRPETPVVLMTAFASVASAVDAMRAGAFDYITKPFENDVAMLAIERAIEHRALEEENRRLRLAVDRTSAMGDLIGVSAAMRDVFALVRKIAHSRASVLITGESGTGKDVVARTIHFHGNRARQPFLPINCTALPEGLLESELFGHVRGAFTGAHATKRGLFEKASGGTLFLDEIGDMSLPLQGKLLRVLQDGEVRPVGSTQPIPVDVRVISATHRDLDAQKASGQFREDLYYRLNVVSLKLPPLADRREDIPLLATHSLRRLAERYKRPVPTLAPDAMALLIGAPWPGNVRQLLNLLEQAVALATTSLIPESLVQGALREDASVLVPFEEARKTFERDYLVRLLKITGGNVTQAALLAKRNRTEFYKLLQRHRLEPAMFKEGKAP